MKFNALGNVTARRAKDPVGTTLLSQTSTYDELGRLLTFVGAATQTRTNAYDKTDNLISVTDPRSNVYGYAFDGLNRLMRETDEGGAQVNLTLNGKDEVTTDSDPRSLATAYVRNGFGDVIRVTSPDTGTTDTVYSALGKATQITDGRGVVTNLTYDNAGRLLTKQYPAATAENITITWDSIVGGNKGKGRVATIQDASGSIDYTYNALGQVTQEKKTTSSVVYTVAEVLSAGSTTTSIYAYPGTSNKLATVTVGASVRTFTHDGAGNITADGRAGTTYNYRYNNRGRLDELSIGTTVTADYP